MNTFKHVPASGTEEPVPSQGSNAHSPEKVINIASYLHCTSDVTSVARAAYKA